MPAKAKPIDWSLVEIAYRAGTRSLTDLGKEFGCSHVAIIKRAKKDGWTRDLSAKIKAKADEKVTRHAVTGKVTGKQAVTEREAVEVESNQQASVRLSHREDIAVLKKTIVGMAKELGALANEEIQAALELILDERCDNASQQYKTALTKAFDAALALSGRSSAGKNLVASLGILIDKERQAFGIDKGGDGPQSLGEFLEALK